MASYEDILEDLCFRTTAVASESKSESLRETLERHEAKGISLDNASTNASTNANENAIAPTDAVVAMDIETEPSIPSEHKNCNQNQNILQVLPFRPSGLTDLLVARLLLTRSESKVQSEAEQRKQLQSTSSDVVDSNSISVCVGVSRALVECLPGVYLPALAQSVSDLVKSHRDANINANANTNANISISLPKTVLRLWVSLFTNAKSPLGVHEKLSEALIALLGRDRDRDDENSNGNDNSNSNINDTLDAATYLVEDWKTHLSVAAAAVPESSSSKSSSVGRREANVAAFRCAVVLVKWMHRLPSGGRMVAEDAGATGLFAKMLGDGTDPLQQLGLLDAVAEEFGDATESKPEYEHESGDAMEMEVDVESESCSGSGSGGESWLSSPALLPTVLLFLKDPLLSDAALRYVGVLSSNSNSNSNLNSNSLKPTDLAIVLDHVREVSAEGIPTRDTDRLPLVRALSGAATSPAALEAILADPLLRRSWWDTSRIAQPKLKAAILVSIAQVLSGIAGSYPSEALRLYKLVGEDHCTSSTSTVTTTTQWLLDKPARSPLVEVRIASLAVLAAALRIPGAALAIVGIADRTAHRSLLELWLVAAAEQQTQTQARRESNFHARAAKFDVLEALLECIDKMPSLLMEDDPKTLSKLQAQRAIGPHGRTPLRYGVDVDVA